MTDLEIDAATEAMHKVNTTSEGLLFSVLMREMAKAALKAAERVREGLDEGTRPRRGDFIGKIGF